MSDTSKERAMDIDDYPSPGHYYFAKQMAETGWPGKIVQGAVIDLPPGASFDDMMAEAALYCPRTALLFVGTYSESVDGADWSSLHRVLDGAINVPGNGAAQP